MVIGLVALGLLAGAVVLTGFFLTGGIQTSAISTFADFQRCGQGLREGGDVKLRGVLVGRIGGLERTEDRLCRVEMEVFPEDIHHIPANSHAQIRAKTLFGEKWVELMLPKDEVEARLAENDVIPLDRTIDPLEVETILNTGMPLLEAVDPENLASALQALVEGFEGHEDAARRGIDQGILALEPFVNNKKLFNRGITQLDEASEVFQDTDQTLLAALDNLHDVNRFAIDNEALIATSLKKTPEMLRELGTVFEQKFDELRALVDSGATVVGILAARTDDLDRLLEALPKFNSGWIRNLDHDCQPRQPGGEEDFKGRCWRVHNLIGHSRGAYKDSDGDYEDPAQDGERPDAYEGQQNDANKDDDDEGGTDPRLVIGPDGEKYVEIPSLLHALIAFQVEEARNKR